MHRFMRQAVLNAKSRLGQSATTTRVHIATAREDLCLIIAR